MAKDQERKLAAVMYIEQGKTAKEIAAKLSLSENTLGKWVADGNWKERRTAKITAGDSLIRSYRTLLQTLVDKRQLLEKEPAKRPGEDDEQRLERAAERDRDKVRLSDEISKINKALDNAEKENKIPLSTYIKVMESIFDSMQKDCPKIYLQLLDFQESHINNIAKLHE
jgi:transposase-like protein